MKQTILRITLVACIGLVGMSSLCVLHVATADDNPFQGPSPATKKVIQKSLDRLKKAFGSQDIMISEKQLSMLKELGFESADQLAKATVAPREPGFPLYVVRLDTLRSYKRGSDPWSLLVEKDASIYPLVLQENNLLEVRSSATVSFQRDPKDNTKIPRVSEMGNPDLIRLLTEARTALQKKDGCLLSSECFAISIPALRLHLFGYRDERTDQFLMATLNHVRGHVKKGDLRMAKDVIEELSNEAKRLEYDWSDHRPNKNKQLPPTNSHTRSENANTD
jgi:hypothetical protein